MVAPDGSHVMSRTGGRSLFGRLLRLAIFALLFVLALPVACISWTITHEEIVREPREWLEDASRTCPHWWQRKLCYMFTCEYCLSHYVAAAFVALSDYQLLLAGWRGYLLGWLALVAVANVYLSAYSRLRVDIHKEKAVTHETEMHTRRAG
jgi:hypothetical protein